MASILIRNACLLPIDESMSVIEDGWIVAQTIHYTVEQK